MIETQAPKTPSHLPSPVIYGPSYPDLKLLLKSGRQIVESRTNRNLRLTENDFTTDGTYTLGRFLRSDPLCGEGRTGAGCPAVIDTWWETDNGHVTKIELRDEIDPTACPFLTTLRDFCPNGAQRAFFDKYLVRGYDIWSKINFEKAFTDYVDVHGPVWRYTAQALVDEVLLDFPALIPEVWLAAIGSDRTQDDETYLSEHPQRVDFVMFAKRVKWVVEIDGPSHYARWDEDWKMYFADESVYTKNLRIERALRRQGWRLHRFSNLEVQEANSQGFRRMTAELPQGQGRYCDREVLEELVAAGLDEDDIPF